MAALPATLPVSSGQHAVYFSRQPRGTGLLAAQRLLWRCTFVGGSPGHHTRQQRSENGVLYPASPWRGASGSFSTYLAVYFRWQISPRATPETHESAKIDTSVAPARRCTLAGSPVARGAELIHGSFGSVLSVAALALAVARKRCTLAGKRQV